jgi:electron transport complex protein RnfE
MSPTRERTFDVTAQLLALCPLVAVSDTVLNAVVAGLTVLIVTPLATAVLALLWRWLDEETALPAAALVIATLVACAELIVQAWIPDLRASLGVFLPLVVANLVIVDHIRSRPASSSEALAKSARIAGGIALTLLPLALARELVGRGSLMLDAGSVLGDWARALELNVFRVDMGFLLAMLPPGAFIAFGLLMALRNWVDGVGRQ